MINKKAAQEPMWGNLIALILGAFFLVAILFVIFNDDVRQRIIDLLPGYGQEDNGELDEDYPGDYLIDSEKIILRFQDGGWDDDFDFWCDGKDWYWSYEGDNKWNKLEKELQFTHPKYMPLEAWGIMQNLRNKSCEEGIKVLMKATVDSAEGVANGRLDVFVGDKIRKFFPGDGILKSPHAFIKRLNRLSEVY